MGAKCRNTWTSSPGAQPSGLSQGRSLALHPRSAKGAAAWSAASGERCVVAAGNVDVVRPRAGVLGMVPFYTDRAYGSLRVPTFHFLCPQPRAHHISPTDFPSKMPSVKKEQEKKIQIAKLFIQIWALI